MFGKVGPWQIALILLLFVMIFGLGKLPQVGSAIGKSIRAFKKSQEDDDEDEDEVEALPKKRKAKSKKKTKTDDSV
ncbi:MAG: twin-arginine translocase TatA/TatE family subunit [Dehalococcoidia bacterium]|nr:twin-arginine translocase TatA/TatE family subunit [Dehalococcoidia bacterium]